MNEEMEKKKERLYDRINELTMLNTRLAKLMFFLNESKPEDTDCVLALQKQLDAMLEYRDALQDRIAKGYF